MTRARARATRCCWPPESWFVMRPSMPLSSTRSRIFMTLSFISSLCTFLSFRP